MSCVTWVFALLWLRVVGAFAAWFLRQLSNSEPSRVKAACETAVTGILSGVVVEVIMLIGARIEEMDGFAVSLGFYGTSVAACAGLWLLHMHLRSTTKTEHHRAVTQYGYVLGLLLCVTGPIGYLCASNNNGDDY